MNRDESARAGAFDGVYFWNPFYWFALAVGFDLGGLTQERYELALTIGRQQDWLCIDCGTEWASSPPRCRDCDIDHLSEAMRCSECKALVHLSPFGREFFGTDGSHDATCSQATKEA